MAKVLFRNGNGSRSAQASKYDAQNTVLSKTYGALADLRRLRLHGLIERTPKTHRYRLTTFGLKTALFYTQAYQRLLRRGLSERHDPRTSESSTLAINFTRFQVTPDAYLAENMAA